MATLMALALSACGGSSNDNGADDGPFNGGGNGTGNGDGAMEIPGMSYPSGGDIDASLYNFPEIDTTLTYGVYDIGYGEAVEYDTYTETWTRDGNQLTLEGSFWSATYTVESDRIITTVGNVSVALPRFANSGDIVMLDEYIEQRVFGPFSDYTFSPGGDLPSRTIGDALVAIEYDSEYEEIIFSVHELGVGVVAEMIFWDCPDDVPLSITPKFAHRTTSWSYLR